MHPNQFLTAAELHQRLGELQLHYYTKRFNIQDRIEKRSFLRNLIAGTESYLCFDKSTTAIGKKRAIEDKIKKIETLQDSMGLFTAPFESYINDSGISLSSPERMEFKKDQLKNIYSTDLESIQNVFSLRDKFEKDMKPLLEAKEAFSDEYPFLNKLNSCKDSFDITASFMGRMLYYSNELEK